MWTMFSLPNYTLCLYFILLDIRKGTFSLGSNIDLAILMNQLIFGFSVFSIGDAFEKMVRIEFTNFSSPIFNFLIKTSLYCAKFLYIFQWKILIDLNFFAFPYLIFPPVWNKSKTYFRTDYRTWTKTWSKKISNKIAPPYIFLLIRNESWPYSFLERITEMQ